MGKLRFSMENHHFSWENLDFLWENHHFSWENSRFLWPKMAIFRGTRSAAAAACGAGGASAKRAEPSRGPRLRGRYHQLWQG